MDLAEVTAALTRLDVREAHRTQAIAYLRTWWTVPRFASYHAQLESLARRQRWALLLDSFYRTIPFGTGGRRGPVGIGPNRVNEETVLTSVQGHAEYLQRRFPNTRLRVVVAYDVRVFRDLRQQYDTALPNPLLGLSSRQLARLACGVYAANGIEVFTVPGDDDYFLSTPELSFAIRALQAHGGLNISASHNHPDDNGAKFYMATGGQPVPPEDEVLAGYVDAVTAVRAGTFEDALARGDIRWWDASCHERYLDANLARSIDPTARGAVIAFTPLQGTGLRTVGDLLPRAGFELRLVDSQARPDGSFAAVKFRIPNPEVPAVMEPLCEEAARLGADVGLATDPDADRLGAVIRRGAGWEALGGNELAVVLAAYIIEARRARGTLPARGFLVKTAVTTSLLERIAAANGLQIIGDLLVGFKYVGAVLDAIAEQGRFGTVEASIDDFLFAAEESNGVQISAAVRDKDAAGGALLLAELCAHLRLRGESVDTYLQAVYRRYGYAANVGYSIVMEGLAGQERLQTLMSRLREHAPGTLDGQALTRLHDYWDESIHGPIRSETDRSARNFLHLEYGRDLRVSVRPSGTEPKIKLYVEQCYEPQGTWAGGGFSAVRAALDQRSFETTLIFVDALLRLIDVSLPRPALLLSSLVALEHRIDFAERFLPELEARLQAGTHDDQLLATWADQRLSAYGIDPRALVAAGVTAYFASRPLPAEQRAMLHSVFS
jgi:phosphoglucomutase